MPRGARTKEPGSLRAAPPTAAVGKQTRHPACEARGRAGGPEQLALEE